MQLADAHRGVLYVFACYISTYMRIYTQRGFLYCLFGMIGFPRTTMSE